MRPGFALFAILFFAILSTAHAQTSISESTAAAGLSGASTVAAGGEVQVFSIGLTGDGVASVSSVALTLFDLFTPTGLASSDFSQLRLYRSTDAALDGGDAQIGSQSSVNIGSSTTVSATTPDVPPSGTQRFYIVSAVLSSGATAGHAFIVGFAAGGVSTSDGGRGSSVSASTLNKVTIGDTTPPAAPAGLTATVGNSQVSLSWTVNSESDVAYYILYRSTTDNFTPTSADSLTRVDHPGMVFLNTGLGAGTYYYKLVAVDSSGNRSSASAQVSASLAPAVSLSVSSLSFGSVNVGSSSTASFTVSNTGTAALSVGSITVSGTDASQFTVSPASFTVNAGASAQTVTVTFTPTGGPGSRSASLSISHNASGSPSSVSLTGTALAPTISLPQTSLAFGDVAVGKSAALNLSVQNTGTATLSISSVTVTGADAAQFAVTVTTRTVAPGQSAVIAVVAFAPTSSGSKSAALSVAHNASGSPATISLSGSALPGRISVLTTALSFGELEVGKNRVLFLAITNAGAGPLSVGSITSTSPRFTVSDTVFTISPNSSREISITFAPTAEGAVAATLTINSNDPDKPSLQVSLSGSGFVIRPRIGISPDRLDFGDVLIGQTKALTLTISNTGRAALSVQEVRVSGPPFSAPSDSFRLDPNGRRELSVTFRPTSADQASGSVTIRSNDPDAGERSVPVTGRGQTPPPEVDFRATDAAGQPLAMGRAPLTVMFTVVNTGGPATGYVWTFGDGSPPGETREATVTYTYNAPGTYTVTLRAAGPGGSAIKVKERLIVVRPAVEADFRASPTSGRAPLTVAFVDSSQGQVASRVWEFGDGDTSTVQNPVHTYGTPGVYTVKLTVRGGGGAFDTKTKERLISIPPVADFAASPVSGLDSLIVAFADSSKGAVSWQWEFGDGETSAEQSPKHTYKRPGVYTVKLTVKGPGGSDVRERQGLILIRQRISADFTASPASGRAPLTVTFTDASKGEITSRLWEFGDGDTSSVQSPTHTYTREDSFRVTLRVMGPAGSDAKTAVIAVVPNKPPARPVPLAPAEGAVGVSLNPTLTWERSADPEGDPVVYDVFLGQSRVRSLTDTSLVIGPLSEGTDYTWRVVAGDDRGGRAEGPVFRFRTAGDTQAPAVLSGPVAEGITRTGATLRWTTDETSRPAVEYRVRGTPAFTASAQGPPGREQGIALAGLLPGVTYEYRVLSRDAAGNVSVFPDPPYPTFTTLTAADVTPPQFTVPASAPFISDTSAVVAWSTDERSSSEAAFRPEADTAFVNVSPGEAGIEHRVVIAGLRPGSAYVVRVRSVDASGNVAVSDLRIVTLPRSAAPTRLRIFNVSVEGRTESQAIIAWSTDRPASSLVRYGLTSLLNPSQTQGGEGGVLEHRVTLTRLNPDTEYFYRVISAASSADSSDVFSFRTRAAARATPPVILRGPVAQGIGQDRATVLWKTDEVSSSAVEFDTVAVLSTRVVTVPEQVTDHAVTLTGLSSGTTYYYRVRSVSLARLSVVSPVMSFTTLTVRDTVAPTILEGPAVTIRAADGFTAEWHTDELSTTEVVYGPTPDSLNQARTAPGLTQRHAVRVGGLWSETRYAFRVRSVDAAGNGRESDVFQVTTLADTLVDRTSPRLVSPPSVAGATHRGATIGWDTDEPANGLVEFGKTEKDLSEVQGEARAYTTGHSVRLTDLSAATTYYYRVSSTDAAGNGPTKSAMLTFTTRAAPDTVPARITSGPTVVSTTDRTAVLEWMTDELSDTQVDYAAGADTTASRLRQQAVSPEATTTHRVTLTNLTPDTTYAFRVSSQDLARNPRMFSEARTFRTQAAPDETPPDLVGSPASAEVTASTATLLWTTDEPTNAVVEYGTGDYNGGRVERGALGKAHTITLTGLTPDTEYRWRITSRDREGNGVTTDPTVTIPPDRTRLRSSDLRFRTTRAADRTPPVIVEGPSVHVSGGNVVVRWVTDELSNSRVVYATRPDYNRPGLESDVFDARLVTVHLVTLAGLDLSTQYLFRCVSADAAGNTVTSGGSRSTKPAEGAGLALQPPGGDGSFTTAPQADRQAPVILSGPTVAGSTSSSLTVEWQTDEASDSFVEYGAGDRTVSRAEDGTPVTRHRIVLTKLSPGTSYTFAVGSSDPSRNGPTRSKPAVGSTAAEVDVTPPRILGSPAISYKSDRQAVVAWRTDEPSSSTVEYRTASGPLLTRSVPDPVTEHRVTLTNLTGATAYTFRVGSIDASNNGPARSQDLTFTTDPTPDTTPPRIFEDPKVMAVTEGEATVEWQTDELSDSAVRYGTTPGALDFNVGSAEAVTEHRVALTNLRPATTYFLRVSSIDRSGNGPTVSPKGGRTVSFTTAAGRDTVPPAQVRAVLGLAGSRVVVLSWPSSPEPDVASYNVYRGMGDEALRLVASNLTSARFIDEGLTDERTYRYAVTALDRAGNEGPRSGVASFTPSARNAPTAPRFREARGKPLMPTFVVENATTPRGTALTYTFQVSARQDFADVVASAVGVKEGNESAEKGLTAWTIPRELTDGGTYYLRVRANDGAFDGPFMPTYTFRAGVLERPGDFNGDLAVDFEDFFLFAGAFGGRATGENVRFDMVKNGEIDFEDFFAFASAFGRRYER